MKRILRTGALMTIGIGTSAAIWLSNKPNRIKAKSFLRDWKHKVKPNVYSKSEILPIEKCGNPNPYDTEDNKMVDEGAVYSVRFYNEKVQ